MLGQFLITIAVILLVLEGLFRLFLRVGFWGAFKEMIPKNVVRETGDLSRMHKESELLEHEEKLRELRRKKRSLTDEWEIREAEREIQAMEESIREQGGDPSSVDEDESEEPSEDEPEEVVYARGELARLKATYKKFKNSGANEETVAAAKKKVSAAKGRLTKALKQHGLFE